MPIIAASVEDNGWVLRLDVTGSLGSFASYVLDPNGTPRVLLTSAHAGFVKSAGQAVPGTINRTLVGTKPLRRPAFWTGSTLAAAVVDETDLGGGVIRVRIALSEHIYATDTGLALAVGAGWRTGEAAASGISVGNNSTTAAPIPIMRWALVPYGVTGASFRLSLYVVSHHPVGFDPVAGVRFTATDGVTVKSAWTTALDIDNSHGDDLRCYTASIDPATATALNAGILRCDAEVFPWLGTVRTTDPAGTRAMTNLPNDGRRVDAQSPWMIGYDPAGTRYSSQFAFIDPVNGTTTASAAMIAATLASARAIAPAARPRTIAVALQAGYLVNRTLPAANGAAAQTRSVDGLQCVLAAGTHAGMGTTSPTTGLAAAEIPVRIYGDPANANPRANCILQTAVTGTLRATRFHLSNMTIEMGTDALTVGGTSWMFDNVQFRGKTGQTNGSVGLLTPAPPLEAWWNVAMTRCRWWQYAGTVMSGSPRIGIFRGNEFSRPVGSFLLAAKNRLIGNAEDPTAGTGPFTALSGFSTPTLTGQVEDIIVAYNDLRFLRGRAWGLSTVPATTAGTPNASLRRTAVIGNIVERIGESAEPFYAAGEDSSATMTYNIIEANSFVGDRANTFYSDPLPANLAAVDSQRNQALVNRVANNVFDWLPTKHDTFNDPTAALRRGNANGYRPQMVDAWSMLYGVGHEGNVDTNRVDNNFALEFSGLRSLNGYSGQLNPQYANDRSIEGPDGLAATGGGDYRPAAGSPAAGRGLRANGDVDAAGRLRTLPFTAGALQAAAFQLLAQPALSAHGATSAAVMSALAPTLVPAAARSGTVMSPVQLVWQAELTPVAAVSVMFAESASLALLTGLSPAGSGAAVSGMTTQLNWRALLIPSVAGLGGMATATGLALTLGLQPGSAILVASSAAPGIETNLKFIRPDASRVRVTGNTARITLPPGTATATLIVGADPRTVIPFRH